MSLPFAPSAGEVALFMLVMARLAGIIVATPLTGGKRTPLPIRAGLTLAITLVMFPVVRGLVPAAPADLVGLVLATAGELAVGLTLGFTVQLVLAAVDLAGQLVGLQMGIGMSNVLDPTLGTQAPLLATFYNFLAVAVFFCVGAHHSLIIAFVDSYKVLAPGQWHATPELFRHVTAGVSAMFSTGLALAAPVSVVLFITNIVLGIMSRAFPAMNVFMLSMPLNIGLGFLVLGVTMFALVQAMGGLFGGLPGELQTLLHLMR